MIITSDRGKTRSYPQTNDNNIRQEQCQELSYPDDYKVRQGQNQELSLNCVMIGAHLVAIGEQSGRRSYEPQLLHNE